MANKTGCMRVAGLQLHKFTIEKKLFKTALIYLKQHNLPYYNAILHDLHCNAIKALKAALTYAYADKFCNKGMDRFRAFAIVSGN